METKAQTTIALEEWMPRKTPDRFITLSEARRAIYLDFEGFVDALPSFVGYMVGDELVHVVTDDRLASAAEAKGIASRPFSDVMGELMGKARREERRVVAYSSHEASVIRKYAGDDVQDVYADGRKIAKRWWNKLKPCEKPQEWSLDEFERCLGLRRPRHLQAGIMTSRLRHVGDQLAKRGAYDALTPTAKAKWTKVLAYNALDVRNLRALLLRAAEDLEG